jgi:hypothetical protein
VPRADHALFHDRHQVFLELVEGAGELVRGAQPQPFQFVIQFAGIENLAFMDIVATDQKQVGFEKTEQSGIEG